MNIQFRTRRRALTAALRSMARRRLGFALDRFAGVLGRVKVHLTREGGSGEGFQPHVCRLLLQARGAGPEVVVAARGGDAASALSLAADRAGHAFARAVDRRRQKLRPRRRRLD